MRKKDAFEIINCIDHNDKVKPERIGRIIRPVEKEHQLRKLYPFGELFDYVDGAGAFITSPLQSISAKANGDIEMITENSIYTLRKTRG